MVLTETARRATTPNERAHRDPSLHTRRPACPRAALRARARARRAGRYRRSLLPRDRLHRAGALHGLLEQSRRPAHLRLPDYRRAAKRTATWSQYFERNRFEYHPENAGTPYEVLLGLLGSMLTAGATSPSRRPSAQPDQQLLRRDRPLAGRRRSCTTGAPTAAWRSSAIRSPRSSRSATPDGKTYTVQYFERNRFEYHPENPARPTRCCWACWGATTWPTSAARAGGTPAAGALPRLEQAAPPAGLPARAAPGPSPRARTPATGHDRPHVLPGPPAHPRTRCRTRLHLDQAAGAMEGHRRPAGRLRLGRTGQHRRRHGAPAA